VTFDPAAVTVAARVLGMSEMDLRERLRPADGPREQRRALLDKSGLARTLGISLGTVHRLVGRGALPHVQIGSRVLFDPTDVERFIRRQKRTTAVHRPGRPRVTGPFAERGPANG
jgi:excisionase family DNA binding protein